MSARSGVRQAVGVVLTGGIVLALAAYLWSRRDDLASVADVPLHRLLLVALLTVLAHYLNAAQFGILYRKVGAHVGGFENWMLYTAGQLTNYLPGQLGTAYRFRYLKVVHDLPYSTATAGYGANLVLSILATGLIGLVGSVWLRALGDDWPVPILLLSTGLLAGAVVASVVDLPSLRSNSRVARAWRTLGQGWTEIRTDRTVMAQVLTLECGRSAVTALRLMLVFGWIGVDEPFAFFLVIAPINSLATFLSFTPAALGTRELSIATVAVALGRNFDDGLVGATLDRSVMLLVTAVLGTAGLLYTARRLRSVGVPEGTAHDTQP